MAYAEAMKAAGATIHAFENFGSYQGDWWALVTLPDGRKGWINGSYGSCSGCDAFEAEFGWSDRDEWCDQHEYKPVADCLGCQAAKAKYQKKLSDFGAAYLDAVMTQEEAVAKVSKDLEWDSDAAEMLTFIQKQASR